MNTVYVFLVTAILDVLWVNSGLYSGHINGGLTTHTIGILWFIVLLTQLTLLYNLTLNKMSWRTRAVLGALQGFTVYSVFNITAKVLFPSWPTGLALLDTAWGTVLYAVSAVLMSSNFNSAYVNPASLF